LFHCHQNLHMDFGFMRLFEYVWGVAPRCRADWATQIARPENILNTTPLILAVMTLFVLETKAGTEEQLAAYRQQIDSLDQGIVKLIQERARVVEEVGQFKCGAHLPVTVPNREQQVIEKAQELAKGGPLPSEAVGRIYQRLVEEMRDWEAKLDGTKPWVRMKTASEEVTDMIFLCKWSSQTLCAGAELGVFDCLSRDGGRTASDVAAETGLDPTLLYRLLRALASVSSSTRPRTKKTNRAVPWSRLDSKERSGCLKPGTSVSANAAVTNTQTSLKIVSIAKTPKSIIKAGFPGGDRTAKEALHCFTEWSSARNDLNSDVELIKLESWRIGPLPPWRIA
jgi:chorismate mutase